MYRYTTTASRPTVIISCEEQTVVTLVQVSPVSLMGEQACRKPCDASLWWKCADLLAVVGNRGQDGAQGFDTHGDVQKMTGKEEVVVVSKQRH